MKFMLFKKPRFYLRKDPDAGWTLALWKWRIAFNVVAGKRSPPHCEWTNCPHRVGDVCCHDRA